MHLQIQRPDRLHTHHHRVRRTAGTQTYCPRHDHFQRISTRREAAGKGTQGQPPRPPATRDPGPPSPYRRTRSTRPTKSRQAHNFERAPGDLPQALQVLPRSLRERQDRHARQPRPACPDEDIPVLLKSCPASLRVARLWSNERGLLTLLFRYVGKRCFITMEQSFGS